MLQGRSALFSDTTIIRRLQTEFVPFAGRRLDLENARSPLSRWWLPLVQNVNPRHRPGYTSQGCYVVGWDGVGYAFDNYNRDAGRLNVLLDRGLAQFRQHPPQPVTIPADFAQASAPHTPPSGASVVRVFTRIRLLPAGQSGQFTFVGREHMWIYPDEVRALLAASENNTGPFAMPRTLVARLVLFHIVDNTRGQVVPWRPQDVSKAAFTARSLRTANGRRTFSFSGDFAKRGATNFFTDRGHEGHIEGEFDVEIATQKITRFRAYAEAQSWAEAPTERPGNPPRGRYPLVIGMIEANDALAQCAPPEPSEAGDYYARPSLPLGR